MSNRRIDFNEPIPQMIERLKTEHRSFECKITEVQDSINNDDIVHAAAIISIILLNASVESEVIYAPKNHKSLRFLL